ncbi:hypothetical protein OJF2_61880 [Aquisphaera giovannonii]|uniref:Uncharacterized protein n=1 Tax=Aquisphaera giovannonii TaxID=406548 RepID=A0A5B9WAV1_9BACT|nr:hypothetical protein [Aquisphaera giovannonii]QEH37597.1 hypothetical protein OJF2_61880 [Aquisphaera giovannonii]
MGEWEEVCAGDEVGGRQAEETGRGRRESPAYFQLEAPRDLPRLEAWRGLKSVGVAIGEAVRDGGVADEVRYDINGLPVEPDAVSFVVMSEIRCVNLPDTRTNVPTAFASDMHRRNASTLSLAAKMSATPPRVPSRWKAAADASTASFRSGTGRDRVAISTSRQPEVVP